MFLLIDKGQLMKTPYFVETDLHTIDSDYSFKVCRFLESSQPSSRRWLLNLYKRGVADSCVTFGLNKPLYEDELGRENIINDMAAWLVETMYPNANLTPKDALDGMITRLKKAFDDMRKWESLAQGEVIKKDDDDDGWVAAMMHACEPDADGDIYLGDGLYMNATGRVFEK